MERPDLELPILPPVPVETPLPSITFPGGFGVSTEILDQLVGAAGNLQKQQWLLQRTGDVLGLVDALHSDILDGITVPAGAADAESGGAGVGDFPLRTEVFGRNMLPPAQTVSFLKLVWLTMEDTTLRLLTGAALLSIILGMIFGDRSSGWVEGTAILAAVVIVVLVTSLNDYSKERKFRKLNAKKEDRSLVVVRNGAPHRVSVYDIVVGDVVKLTNGDSIPCDGIYLSGASLRVDESSATGESDDRRKGPKSDMILLGDTKVVDGFGTMLAIAVGERSSFGKQQMAMRVNPDDADSDTPLQKTLAHMAEQIGKAGIAVAILLFLILTVRMAYEMNRKNEEVTSDVALDVLRFFITSLTIVVVAVPEGLPLAVTIALAYSMIKMVDEENLVRKLEACETMGGATSICTDKTGTLTQNRMTVVEAFLASETYADGTEHDKFADNLANVKKLIFAAIALNSTAVEVEDKQSDTDAGSLRKRKERAVVPESQSSERKWNGSKTEIALLDFVMACGGNYVQERAQAAVKRLYPFSSERKRMSVVAETKPGSFMFFTKGASEIVLAKCDKVLAPDGTTQPMDSATRENLEDKIYKYATAALRTISIAYVELADDVDYSSFAEDHWNDFEEISSNLVLIGMVGIMDPLRPGVQEAVRDCQRASITVRMITGDNLVTAINIAKNCGIYDPAVGRAMEGEEFRSYDEETLRLVVPNLQVLARSSPLDKQKFVAVLQSLDEVVAMTGDGTNDGPALKLADVGFAMGIAGTEVAKEASDIVLMDDNFVSIVSAVLRGRNVFDSIRKFLQFQLTINIVAVAIAFIGSLESQEGESPLKPVQLLWINMIMDTMAALALATENPTRDMLDRKPYGRNPQLITVTMGKHILGQSIYQLFVSILILFYGNEVFPDLELHSRRHETIVFNSFVWMQLGNEINCRRIYDELNVFSNIGSNWLYLGIMVFTMVVQVIFVQFGGRFTSTQALTLAEWIVCVSLGLLSLPIGFILRLIPFPVHKEEIHTPPPIAEHHSAIDRWHKTVGGVIVQQRVVEAFRRKRR